MLVTAFVFGLVVVPTLVLPKFSFGGLRVTVGAFSVCATPIEVLVRKLPSPEYWAVGTFVG